MKKKDTRLTELELEVMQCIWARGIWCSVEEIVDDLARSGRRLAPPSVRTMLRILENKAYLKRKEEGRKHLYTAMVSRENSQQQIALNVVQSAFGGSATDLIAALVKSGTLDPEDLDGLRDRFHK